MCNEEDISVLSGTELFKGVGAEDIKPLLGCLNGQAGIYARRETVFREGDDVGYIGVVLSGGLQIFRESYDGRRAIIGAAGKGDIFAEAFVCAGAASPVSAAALDAGVCVMRLEFNKIMSACPSACGFHKRLIENLLRIVARKNLYLQDRMEILSGRTTREKLLTCFLKFAGGKAVFKLPFTHEELADYLCINRSAMSRELSAMRRDGMIRTEGRTIEIVSREIYR